MGNRFCDPINYERRGKCETNLHVAIQCRQRGNLDTDTEIQKRLGWSLGFRAAEVCRGRQHAGDAADAHFGGIGRSRIHKLHTIRLSLH